MTDPVLREYARLAPRYDTRWAFYIQESTRQTLVRLSIQPGDRVLDVGCGTGVLLAGLAESCPGARLVGIDPVPEMLAIARRRVPAHVELRQGRAERIPAADGSFDLVVSCNMFHYVGDPSSALREMTRVLRPGGRVLITDWCDDYLACRLCDLYLRLVDPAHRRIYGTRACARLLRAAGFCDVKIDRYKISWIWGLMTARAAKPVQ